MGYLLSPMVPFELLEAIQGVNIIIVILSKVSQLFTIEFLNFGTPKNFAVIYLKFKQRGQTFFFWIQFKVPFKIISLIDTSQSVGGAKREYPGKTT